MTVVSKVYAVSDADFKNLVQNSDTITSILWQLGYSKTKGSGKTRELVRKRVQELSIPFETVYTPSNKIPDEAYYVFGVYRDGIRNRVLKDNFMPYECEKCGNKGIWENIKLTLQLDHIDGDAENNKKENLRWLCPNCHSQTDTYGAKKRTVQSTRTVHRGTYGERVCLQCAGTFIAKTRSAKYCSLACSGKSKKTKLPVTKEELYSLLAENSFTKVANMYAVSDNTIRKWCVKLGISNKASYYRNL